MPPGDNKLGRAGRNDVEHIEQANPLTGHTPRIESSKRAMTLRQLALPLFATAIAFFPRVFRLDGHDIWGDEAFSIYVSSQNLGTIVSGGIDVHPPLYYALLHYWLMLFGRSEFAIRFLSVGIGLLVVVLTYALARRLVGPRAAVAAALISAISPFQVYYSQEARMYTLVTCLALVSVYTLVHALARPKLVVWAVYLLSTVGAVYSHYYAFAIVAAEVVVVTAWGLVNRRQVPLVGRLRPLVLCWLVVVLSYVPWVLAQSSLMVEQSAARMGSLTTTAAVQIIKQSLLAFAVGTTVPGWLGNCLGALVLLAFLGGVGWLVRRSTTRLQALLIVLYSGAPLAFAVLASPFMPYFYPRYVVLATPAYYIAVGVAVAVLSGRWKALGAASLAVFIIASGYALQNYYFDPSFARGGYGQMMRYVASHAGPNDALILGNTLQEPLFQYYRPAKPVDTFYFPTDYLTSDPRTGEDIAKIMAEHDRAWLVMFGDPSGFDPNGDLKRWLGQNAFLTHSQGFGDAHLSLYSKPTASQEGQPLNRQEVSANFGSLIELTAAEFPAQPTPPGQPLYLTLHWKSLAPTDVRYTVFAHLVDANSQKLGQMDSEPVAGTRPTSNWKPGESIRDTLAIVVKPDATPGQYVIEVGLYELASGQRLPVLGPDGQPKDRRVQLGPVVVGP